MKISNTYVSVGETTFADFGDFSGSFGLPWDVPAFL